MERLTTIITGASSGIGKELVFSLAAQFRDRNLVLTSRNFKALNEIKKTILKQNPSFKIETIKCDVSDKNSVEQMIKKSYAKFNKIDHFILNAGVSMWIDFKNIEDIDIIKKIMEINYLGVVYPLHFAFEKILKQNPKIIILSSAQSFIPLPYHSGYVASKYATNGFLDTLRQEELDIDIREIMLGWVRGTSLRDNALGKLATRKDNPKKETNEKPTKKSSTKKNLFACEVEECVDALIQTMQTPKSDKTNQIYLPKIIALIPLVKVLFPKLLYRIIRKITNKE